VLKDKSRERRSREAEEIVSETITRAWQKQADYHPDLGDVDARLCGILRRIAHENCRKLRNSLEEQQEERLATAKEIASVVQVHLPSARLVDSPTDPLTVAAALAANEALKESPEPLPADLGLPALVAGRDRDSGPPRRNTGGRSARPP
jgi:DNA-directed RNA polymerase specialized sigma24 family protein